MIPLHTLSTYNDQQLVALLATGDRDAFAEIYRRYWEVLLGMAYNRLKNLAAAEDIVHDVFGAIWHNRRKQEIKSLNNYLAAAVKYAILKEARRAELQRVYRQKENGLLSYYISPDTSIDNKRVLEMLRHGIAALPDKCRLVFRFSREEGMTVKQIAERMQISPKTVENQMNKALRQLRQTLKSMLSSFISLCF